MVKVKLALYSMVIGSLSGMEIEHMPEEISGMKPKPSIGELGLLRQRRARVLPPAIVCSESTPVFPIPIVHETSYRFIAAILYSTGAQREIIEERYRTWVDLNRPCTYGVTRDYTSLPPQNERLALFRNNFSERFINKLLSQKSWPYPPIEFCSAINPIADMYVPLQKLGVPGIALIDLFVHLSELSPSTLAKFNYGALMPDVDTARARACSLDELSPEETLFVLAKLETLSHTLQAICAQRLSELL